MNNHWVHGNYQIYTNFRKHWDKPWTNMLGNPHYHRDTRYMHKEKMDWATDPMYKKKFS